MPNEPVEGLSELGRTSMTSFARTASESNLISSASFYYKPLNNTYSPTTAYSYEQLQPIKPKSSDSIYNEPTNKKKFRTKRVTHSKPQTSVVSILTRTAKEKTSETFMDAPTKVENDGNLKLPTEKLQNFNDDDFVEAKGNTETNEKIRTGKSIFPANFEFQFEKCFEKILMNQKKTQEVFYKYFEQQLTTKIEAMTSTLEEAFKQIFATWQSGGTIFSDIQDSAIDDHEIKVEKIIESALATALANPKTLEKISTLVAKSFHDPIINAFYSTSQNYIVPAFNASCQVMMQQLQSTFQKGLLEYQKRFTTEVEESHLLEASLNKLQSHIQIYSAQFMKCANQSNEKVLDALKKLNANFEAFKEVQFKKNNELSQLLESLYQMQLQLCTRQSDFLTRQQKLKRNSESTILGSPTSLAEEKRETHLVSRFGAFQKEAQDVAPPTLRRGNLWGKISACLRSGDYENAFTLALSAKNIKFLEWLSTAISLDELFKRNPLPLSQSVLLSLIHQVSSERLLDAFYWKYNILLNALPCLNRNDAVTKYYLPAIIKLVEGRVTEGQKQALTHVDMMKLLTLKNKILNLK
ncbi:enhancer of mRNA-decapping protein 4-like [Zophobas morio]|uniref:enhancer of mRNA-decapping protein 4-like n=1 Tax=Zophobas morio TaxID=2755281 RepID=UPI003082BDD3